MRRARWRSIERSEPGAMRQNHADAAGGWRRSLVTQFVHTPTIAPSKCDSNGFTSRRFRVGGASDRRPCSVYTSFSRRFQRVAIRPYRTANTVAVQQSDLPVRGQLAMRRPVGPEAVTPDERYPRRHPLERPRPRRHRRRDSTPRHGTRDGGVCISTTRRSVPPGVRLSTTQHARRVGRGCRAGSA